MRGFRGHPVVRRALIKFAAWLRVHFEFPIRLPVYLLVGPYVLTQSGARCSASFFAPWRRSSEPYIRIVTGDYSVLRDERGRDNALASFIISFAHEIVHYQQWIATGEVSERGVSRRASGILARYCQSTDRP